MATVATANRAELIAIANSVASEKMIDKSIVIEALEEAIQRAAKTRYGIENDIRAKLDPQTGDLRLWRVVEVVEAVDDYFKQVDVNQAQKLQKGATVGDYIVDPLPPIEFGRIQAQASKQIIFQKVRDAERERQYEEFKDRQGEIITGVVKRVEFGHIVVDLGRAEGVIRRDQQIPREVVRVNDRIRSLILNVRRENRGPQIFLSRAHPDFMKKLFAQEVPEIYDGIITIQAAARDPGSRAKIGVISRDSSIDPVGACVGMKGSRVQAVVQEMQGEKIDIIPWSPDTATFVVNALQPASVSRVVIDEEEDRIEVVVPDDQLSLAIGRRGQNVRLASQLTGKAIDILTEADASEKRQKEFVQNSEMFQNELDVDETLAQLLVAEGFGALEEVAYVELDELAGIEGFDEDLAQELQSRAQEALDRREAAARDERRALGVEDALADMPYLTEAMLVTLGKAGIKTLDDLADLATDELVEKKRAEPRRRNEDAPKRPEPKGGILAEYGLSDEQGNEIIMAARQHWFEDEAPAAADAPASTDASEGEEA
ncbi:MAG: transcription termination factor NusA [Sphingomonas aquatilis]|jgi:transcription termination/antitermination protein NusA|uniref:Transcription termination/antitermination protein NusA n=3 Tax=Sphingomonas melonis TaxID=152682 RepID=A0A0D1K701_9SPHN|nr:MULTISPECIES: transcription termination factor NusA [Sphingomonas]ANC87269.1 transcription termination/antitermination protein NusA [Sphingomonas sp. NIC1]AOW23237.1 transcription termination/antitermination protein NusA [Sphingomonas melonis TY]ATI56671.1 transcription termination/antitermination protein NusA [Sphingomonas melonis]KIU29388.1 transcription elongation factor NusA [Sphingomonas melonis]KZB95101.1 transcription termination/antitermination protein NusA [Sphingomonas melonis TY]